MFPLCGLVLLLCLQRGGLCSAFHVAETLTVQVDYGQSALLHCNGSAFLEEEGTVHWEAMGQDVAILGEGESILGEHFEGRVQVPPDEQFREGNWSVVLNQTMLSDTDMYECIWQGGKTISTVWLTVREPEVERSMTVYEGTGVDLACYIHISKTAPSYLEVWWTRNGSSLISIKNGLLFTHQSPDSDTVLMSITDEEFRLYITPTMSDSGEYQCWYRTRESDSPKLGIPESITLTVLEGFNPDEPITATEDWVSTSHWPVTPWTEDVTETTESHHDFTPVLLEDSTQPMPVATESQLMEAFEEMVTFFPYEDTPSESELDDLPWIRIGLISGVLLVTAVVLCVLGALRKI
ncbi:uncharacterized protein LOC111562801 [Amphiprion ocellaris]|uniref:uncharacterized protein LOC111562801 n=1 Tax=Amphiprion ocellaris TaxID=80972 RepID=UPI000C30ECC2|nr:uncharacterized protein LOC111562801 [Amphiprion ocellaris]XP_023117302.1 uncharacterized protein LOC111562801 [Amphiprion ocellaris]XP_054864684.1 uncharacterized protein LOC111562801 [Amphiprion ocellaris]